MTKFQYTACLSVCLSMLLVAGCRKDELVLRSAGIGVTEPVAAGEVKGFFLLNEGNMGNNKASLDYFDYATGTYHRNIFAERNPGVARELGDVGNDIQIHDGRLYAVINCSNLVEVMDVATARHIGVVSVPNCRNIVFKDGYAYVSSYAGPVQVDPTLRPGKVVKVDLGTLRIVGECTVGRQPEQMVLVDDRLYVANSGGYTPENYDTTVSVIDLATFTEIKKIEVAINLRGMELDERGCIWLSSRGDNNGTPSKTCVIDSRTDRVIETLDLPNSGMALGGDLLYVCSAEWSDTGQRTAVSYATVDTRTMSIVDRSFIADGTEKSIKVPYGLAVNPENGEIFVTDAGNYVTPGRLHCYSREGIRRWSVTTGDIPAHIVFTTRRLLPLDSEPEPEPSGPSPYITRVLDYMPAVGQFTNLLPEYEHGDTQQTMNAKVLEAIGDNNRGMVSLGGYGGYVVVGFDHTIENVAGLCDFRVRGNAFGADAGGGQGSDGGSSEAGVILVARDTNGNGMPDDDEWFEIAGSAHEDPAGEPWYQRAVDNGNDVNLYRDYRITYHRPASEAPGEAYIVWEDNKGNSGYKAKNMFHSQSYFPQRISGDRLTFEGTRLPQNSIDESGTGDYYVVYRFRYGYADNVPNGDDRSAIDIDWAVDRSGRKVHLSGVDFIKIYTGVNQENGDTGECSTELTGIEDLHLLDIEIEPEP